MWARSLMDTEVIHGVLHTSYLSWQRLPVCQATWVARVVGGRKGGGGVNMGGTVKCFHCRKGLCVSFGRSPVSPLSPKLEASTARQPYALERRGWPTSTVCLVVLPQPHSLPLLVCFRPLWLEISASLSPSNGSPLLPPPIPAAPVLIHTVVICFLA